MIDIHLLQWRRLGGNIAWPQCYSTDNSNASFANKTEFQDPTEGTEIIYISKCGNTGNHAREIAQF